LLIKGRGFTAVDGSQYAARPRVQGSLQLLFRSLLVLWQLIFDEGDGLMDVGKAGNNF